MASNVPFNVLIKRVVKKILPKKNYHYHLTDTRLQSANLSINNFLHPSEYPKLSIDSTVIENYLNHNFNYLGSGWINRNKKNNQLDVLAIHQTISNKITKLIDKDYQQIDWQKEIIADYDFDIKNLFNKQKIINGVDIKHPWELGRLQHLPRIALFAIHATNKSELIAAFKNQTLDFIANNPIGMGVQWACTMDVGIRVSNLLMAYDIFSQIDKENILDDEFKIIFADAIHLHGQFIFNHLEFKEGLTGNHYLFNLSGLLFASSYLTKTEKTKKWLEFSMREIEKEVSKQFFEDGGNFEGSTTYHCLSTEMLVYSTALMFRNNYNFSNEFKNRFVNTADFILAILKPNGTIPQFGDNDSGRYFKLSYIKQNNDENLLNYEGLISSFSGTISENTLPIDYSKFPIENAIISHLANGKKIETNFKPLIFASKKSTIKDLDYSKKHEISFDKIENLIEKLSFKQFPDFGLSIFKSKNFYLAISTISNKKMHHSWGHVHNDKLSFELFVNGLDLIKDAGSFCYTSNIEMRNKFRATKAHQTIDVNGIEQNNFISTKNGLFYLEKESTCKLLELTKNSIKLQVNYYGLTHIRNFEIFENKIIITDYCNKPFVQNFNSTILSSAYGKLIN